MDETTGDLMLNNGLDHHYTNGRLTGDTESDPYEKDSKHSKYWRSLQAVKPVRFPKLVESVISKI